MGRKKKSSGEAPPPPTPEEIEAAWQRFARVGDKGNHPALSNTTVAELRDYLEPAIPSSSEIPEGRLVPFCAALSHCPPLLKPILQQKLAERYFALPKEALVCLEPSFTQELGMQNPDSSGMQIVFAFLATLKRETGYYGKYAFGDRAALNDVQVEAAMERTVVSILNSGWETVQQDPNNIPNVHALLNTSMWRRFTNLRRDIKTDQLPMQNLPDAKEDPTFLERNDSATSTPVRNALDSWLAVEKERRREAFDAERRAYINNLPQEIAENDALSIAQKEIWKVWAEKALANGGEPPMDKEVEEALGITHATMRSRKFRSFEDVQDMFVKEGLVRFSDYKKGR